MMHNPLQKAVFLFLLSIGLQVSAQSDNPQENEQGIRIMFYNLENLFHPSDDSLKNDDEFTKDGTRYWSFNRYKTKLANSAKTMIAVGGWEPPAIIGVCEVENLQCLKDLVYESPLQKFGYKIVHEESPDNRGIDVALLYREEFFSYISHEAMPLQFPEEGSRPSRDILYVKGTSGKDTLHLFVNHWPSRYGGQMATLPKRNYAATVLRAKIDSITTSNANAHCIAMGDFNDHPEDESMLEILRAKKSLADLKEGDLVNMIWQYEGVQGTHKFEHQWGVLDQFVVTRSLFGELPLITSMDKARIFDADFLLEPENDGVGKKPNRTYIGFKYHGGYSDHLPIYLDILYQ